MESNDTPLWALELREFTEFSLGKLEQRLGSRIDSVEHRLETITRKIDKMDDRLEDLALDVRQIKTRITGVERR